MTDAAPDFRQQVEQAEQQQPQVETPAVPEPDPDGAVDFHTTGDDGAPQVRKVVPLSALHETRRQAKQAREQAEEAQRTAQALQQQNMAIMQEFQRRMQPQVQPVDAQQDPLGAAVQQAQMTQAEVRQLRAEQAQREQVQMVERQVQAFAQGVNSSEAAFVAKTPDYYQALNFLRDSKLREYTTAGLSESQAMENVRRDAIGLSQQCLQRGQNPAEVAYAIAKNFGYKPQPDAAKKMEMQANGQRASTPTGGSGQGGGRLSLDALAKMSPKDFAKATEGDKWRELMSKS